MRKWLYSSFSILNALTLSVIPVQADTFEFLEFAPPRGWVQVAAPDGMTFRRTSGVGLVYFYSSVPAAGSAEQEFAAIWRRRVEQAAPAAKAPKPQVENDKGYAAAVGAVRITDAHGVPTAISLVVFAGHGRTLAVLTISAGDGVTNEVTAFLNSIEIKAGSPSKQVPSDEIAVDFDIPPGYVSRRDGRSILLTPTSFGGETQCAYGIAPLRPSTGNLQKDAAAALGELFPGWRQRINSSYAAMRGIGGGGWNYFWYRTDVERNTGGQNEYANIMAMALTGAGGKVNIVFGIGNIAHCQLNDTAFVRLFHSLRPRGVAADSGKVLARELQGTWRLTESSGLSQYKFNPGGLYEAGLGAAAGYRTYSNARDGRWELRGSELTLTGSRGVEKYRIRIYEETDSFTQRWQRTLSLLDESSKPAREVQYMHIDESK